MLYKIELKAKNNKHLAPQTLYLRASSIKVIKESFPTAMNYPESEYYGYYYLNVEKVPDVPEIRTVKVPTIKTGRKK